MNKDITTQVDINRRVYVYRNLHRNCWSIRQGGIVRVHAHFLSLTRARFHVSEAGRQRVIREQRKNVHAGISGIIGARKDWFVRNGCELSEVIYDPYTMPTFRYEDTGQSIERADRVFFNTFGKQLEVLVELLTPLKEGQSC